MFSRKQAWILGGFEYLHVDNVTADPGAGGSVFASDDIAGVHYPRTKVTWGPDGTANDADVASGKPLPVQLRTSGGTETGTAGNPIGVNDASGSLTMDFSGQKTSDYDTGAGTDTVLQVGIALPASGGAVQGGTSTNPIRTDPTGTTTQPVSGTVTANLAAGTNNIGDVDVLSLPALPAGTNNIGDVDVLTLPALPAGTNNIGDVDVLSVVPGTGATALGKAEDDPHASGDVGVLALAVRRDTAAVGSGLDGDNSTLNVNASGRLYTSATVDAALPAGTNNIGDVDVLTLPALPAGTNNIGDVDVLTLPALPAGTNNIGDVDVLTLPALPAGTNNIGDVDVLSVVPGTGATALGKAEDDPHASGDTGVLMLAVRRDTAAVGSGLDGDNSTLNVNSTGRLYTSSTVDAALPAGTNNIGDVDVLTLPALPAGTNNIGDVDVLSIAAGDNNIGNVDIVTQPARARTTDHIGAADTTDAIMNGLTALTPKFAIIDAATSGDNTLVAAVSSKKIRVVSLFLVSAGTVTVRFESGAGGTALSGQMNLVANTGFVLPYNPVGWFETAATTLLNMELSAAISCDGSLVYVEV